MSEILRFETFSSTVEPEFWAGLAHHKLHSAQLDTRRTPVRGEFVGGRRHTVRGNGETGSPQKVAVPARLRVSQDAWGVAESGAQQQKQQQQPVVLVSVEGYLLNTNTVEEFKKYDKGELLRSAGAEVLDAIRSGRATQQPGLLWPFLLLTFADLKKYRFHHWFAFPAVTADPPDEVTEAPVPISKFVARDKDLAQLLVEFAAFSQANADSCSAFVARYRPEAPDRRWRICALGDWDEVNDSAHDGMTMLGFVDPSSHATRPGWPLRNLLTWLRHQHPEVRRTRVLCFRDAVLAQGSTAAAGQQSESIVLEVDVTPTERLTSECRVSGWERDAGQRLAPRTVDLSSTMDPERLATSALDLNLQLMRWRLAPEIDLARIANTRALLVGAGTLGAYVARGLLAWGMRKITFVDNGRVSFSNPPRQPLYEFADSVDGGKPKAEAAASSMRRIFPRVDAQGVQLSVPMPGHAVPAAEVEDTRAAAAQLEQLIVDHDVVFLLTDSRESRWLPTMLGALHRKLVLCVALGFDSFVAMRHGVIADYSSEGSGAGAVDSGTAGPGTTGPGTAGTRAADPVAQDMPEVERLGCYFCNDVVAPTDSLADRTLDQQCTVTRPGLAPIASGTAVELLATILQHPLGGLAPAADSSGAVDGGDVGVFGAPAHQIRGHLTGFRQHAIVGQASSLCTACSPRVIEAYRQHGFEFLQRVFNNTPVAEDSPHRAMEAAGVAANYSYLETLTGLAALHRETDRMLEDIEWSENEELGSDGGFETI
ncbi:Autophagy protein 7 [Coemansia sp. RSA 988]|nr:Autophagy protein 7 [Coemansia sp. RSA 988]